MQTHVFDAKYDAVIVGARCAGAATAIQLSEQGWRVMLLDRASPGKDTLSTHALMRSGVLELSRLGVLRTLERAGTPLIVETTFHYGDEVLPLVLPPKHGVSALIAPRRQLLDRVLVDRARQVGAHVAHGVRVTDVVRSANGRVAGVAVVDGFGRQVRIDAGVVIGADGRNSTVAKAVGAAVDHSGHHASAVAYGYFTASTAGGYRWYYRPEVSAGVVPTNDGSACVFVVVPSAGAADRLRRDRSDLFFESLGRVSVDLRDEIAQARATEPLRGFAGVPGFVRRASGPGWALVGDAGSFRDPITAFGISEALGQARLLARHLAGEGTSQSGAGVPLVDGLRSGSAACIDAALARYSAARDDLSLPVFKLSDEIASFRWDLPTLRQQHLQLNRLMKRHAQALFDLDARPRENVAA